MKPGPLAAYFLTPFPSTKGFSPYRMPGPIFHLSIAAAVFVVGLSLCIPGNALATAWLLAVWIVAGVYGGRDLAIRAHYAPIVLLPWLIAVVAVFVAPNLLDRVHESLAAWSNEHYPEGAIGTTAAVGGGFALWVWWSVHARDRQDA